MPYVITVICIFTLTNTYNDWLLQLLRQFPLIPNRIIKFMDLGMNCSTSRFNQFCCNLINAWWFVLFLSFSIAISTKKALGSGTSGSAVCISLRLTSLTQCIFNSWEKWFPHLAKILWESATRSPFSFLTVLVLDWQPFLKSMMPQ